MRKYTNSNVNHIFSFLSPKKGVSLLYAHRKKKCIYCNYADLSKQLSFNKNIYNSFKTCIKYLYTLFTDAMLMRSFGV